MIGLSILDIETQLNSLKIKWIQNLLNPTNALWKNLMLYQLNLLLNYNLIIKNWPFIDKNRSLDELVTNILQKHEDLFIQLPNS